MASVPAAEPRRPPSGTRGDYASALALRIAGAVGLPAEALAADIAAELRLSPHVVSAAAEGRGFVNVTLTPRARVSLVRAACGANYLMGYRPAPADRGGRAAAAWALTPLHAAETVVRAREWAREDARRRMVLAAGADGADDSGARPSETPAEASGGVARRTGPGAPGRAGAAGPGGSAGPRYYSGPPPSWGSSGRAADEVTEVTWRDPYLDEPPGESDAARLLAVLGEASARFAFCRSAPEHPRAGELTGPGLPALPTAEEPGNWERHTAANPGFAVRYAHAHAVRTRAWAADLGFVPSRAVAEVGSGAGARGGALADDAVAALDEPLAAALAGCLFDGPGVLSAAAGRRQPHILVRYLEGVATAYHDWRESCTAVPTSVATDAARGEVVMARLELCAAVAGVLRTGLSLLGVPAPTRL